MIELVKSSVVFHEEDHTYFLDGKQLQGITGMISRQLFPDKYKDVPEFVLKKAAEKGRRIHTQCQFVDSTGFAPESIEAENYLRERVNAGYNAFANEYTVSDNEYFASNIDCVWEKEGRISIADIKTTYSLDKEYLSWQLSIYACLFELQNPLVKVHELFGMWLRGDKSELIPIQRKPDVEVKKLMECEIKGERYLATTLVPVDGKQLIPVHLVNAIIDIEEQAMFISGAQKEYKEKLKTAMRDNGIKTWDAGRLRVSYSAASKSMSFDSKRFQEDHPELYRKYVKETIKADSIRVTIREEEK